MHKRGAVTDLAKAAVALAAAAMLTAAGGPVAPAPRLA